MPYLHDVFIEYGITRCLVSLLVFSLASNDASSQDRADVKAVDDQRINEVGRAEVRTLSTVLVGTDDTIAIGDVTGLQADAVVVDARVGRQYSGWRAINDGRSVNKASTETSPRSFDFIREHE